MTIYVHVHAYVYVSNSRNLASVSPRVTSWWNCCIEYTSTSQQKGETGEGQWYTNSTHGKSGCFRSQNTTAGENLLEGKMLRTYEQKLNLRRFTESYYAREQLLIEKIHLISPLLWKHEKKKLGQEGNLKIAAFNFQDHSFANITR